MDRTTSQTTEAPSIATSNPAAIAALRPAPLTKAVVVHAGARDAYQLALALSEAGMLENLVTDLFWPRDRSWAKWLEARLSPGLREMLERRSAPGLPARQVTQRIITGLRLLLFEKLRRIPFSLRRQSIRAADSSLGRTAGKRARQIRTGLVSYSYCGYDAIREYGRPALLFQAHPHPATIRRLLLQELIEHPECAPSLQQEWELALPEPDFQRLVDETTMAARFLVASTFTRNSLVEHGASPAAITVVPYGVDLERFRPATQATLAAQPPRTDPRLRLLFVGRINQRKGISYLLEALRLLGPDAVHLTICGRVVDDLELFRPFGSQIDIRPSVSAGELVRAYQAADLFVFPSVAEGFGQVLLESLACGLPILSTTHTAAPDLIEDGVQGFIVEPRRPDLLAERIAWAIAHPAELAAMHTSARLRAEEFTWQRFRTAAATAVATYLATTSVT